LSVANLAIVLIQNNNHMKKLLGLIIVILWGATASMAQQYHYYYGDTKVGLELNTSHAYLLLQGVKTPEALKDLLPQVNVTAFSAFTVPSRLKATAVSASKPSGDHWAEVALPEKLDAASYFAMLQAMQGLPNVVSAQPYFTSDKAPDERLGISNLIMVKLRPDGSEAQLQAIASEFDLEILGQNLFMPQWYTLSVTKASKGNAIEVANRIYETGQFEASEPDLMVQKLTTCVNDALFNLQWGLNHTSAVIGTVGLDVNACAAWSNWGYGSNTVQIAVLDHGFEQNHPDLSPNNVGTGWNTQTASSPAAVLGNHGTACAGIVAAQENNTIGVSGIAPNCGIISISDPLLVTANAAQDLANGLNWAWQNGAEVISNSWGHNALTSSLIDNAITNALANGRGGLGTVVVFAAGNSNSSVIYPASSNPAIMVVGGCSPCGERKSPTSCDGETFWGASFGSQVDVVGPCVLIPTTDRQGSSGYNTASGTAGDYHNTFNGTSSATPHVAGFAGLLLSMNPCLTQLQVCNIIERTAQKVGTYGYATVGGRPNGTWHQEMGYGLIDIDAGMRMTRELYVQNVTFTGTEVRQVQGSLFAGYSVDVTQPLGDVNVNSGSNVSFHASSSITLSPGFIANSGSVFLGKIITTNCSDWNNSAARLAPPLAQSTSAESSATPTVGASRLGGTSWQVMPNPFGNALTLRYELAQTAMVQAQLYNAQGQLAHVLVSPQAVKAGSHEVKVDLSESLAHGFYFLRLTVGEQTWTQKLVHQ
jgi:serine protease